MRCVRVRVCVCVCVCVCARALVRAFVLFWSFLHRAGANVLCAVLVFDVRVPPIDTGSVVL